MQSDKRQENIKRMVYQPCLQARDPDFTCESASQAHGILQTGAKFLTSPGSFAPPHRVWILSRPQNESPTGGPVRQQHTAQPRCQNQSAVCELDGDGARSPQPQGWGSPTIRADKRLPPRGKSPTVLLRLQSPRTRALWSALAQNKTYRAFCWPGSAFPRCGEAQTRP